MLVEPGIKKSRTEIWVGINGVGEVVLLSVAIVKLQASKRCYVGCSSDRSGVGRGCSTRIRRCRDGRLLTGDWAFLYPLAGEKA